MNTMLAKAFLTLCTLSIAKPLLIDYEKFALGGYIPWKLGKCLVPTVQQNFQTEKFFKDHWYQQSSYGNFLFQADGICPTVEYKITDAGEILELDYHFEQMLMKYISVNGNSYTQFIKDGQGYLPVTYSILGGLLSIDVPMFIVGTDYDNWAVVYSCKQQLFMKAEMSWIMTRSRNSTDQQQAILDTLQKNNMKITDYIKSVNVGCGPDEPHL
ncbi:hypothetical protein O3M35_012135 [Rhynocoris fuscipes]|uniref:Uncharacterized protein n=1 Tax=Rhynocoris fuscipes TaxID=488301 RepID=A0AAW1CXQ9_9HEMI